MKRVPTIAVACTLSFLAGGAAMWAQQSPSRPPVTRREPLIDNEHVQAWKSIILPKQPLSQHRHDHGRALIALTDGKLQVIDPKGKLLDTYNWEKGKAYWLDADPPGQTHADVNSTDKPIEVIVVQLKKDK